LIYTILQYTQNFLHKAQITASVSQTSVKTVEFSVWAPLLVMGPGTVALHFGIRKVSNIPLSLWVRSSRRLVSLSRYSEANPREKYLWSVISRGSSPQQMVVYSNSTVTQQNERNNRRLSPSSSVLRCFTKQSEQLKYRCLLSKSDFDTLYVY